uniref:Uncharacterized protein n=1 Tax=Arundo donax TaxID=35708 RepID=A0A0A8Y770_ARUDO
MKTQQGATAAAPLGERMRWGFGR